MAEYEKLKSELSETLNPHRTEYLENIAEWKAVAIWCKENGTEKELLAIAEEKISKLSQRLEKGGACKPLAREDKFVTEPEWNSFELEGRKLEELVPNKYIEPDFSSAGTGFGFNLWRDRLDSVKKRKGITDETDRSVGAIVDKLNTRKHRDGARSASRLACLQASTTLFKSFVGPAKDIATVNGKTMTGFFEALQVKVDGKSFSPKRTLLLDSDNTPFRSKI